MDEQASSQPTEALVGETVKIIAESFAHRRQVVLLSYVGQTLVRRGVDFRAILGEEKLADFVRRQLAEYVKIVSMPSDPLILAAYPADVDLTKEIDPFGRQGRQFVSKSERGGSKEKRALILREVWFAFSHRLADDHHRVLRLKPVLEYEDVPDGTEPEPDGYPIDRGLIVPSGSLPRSERDEQLYSNVQMWAEKAGVDFQDLIEERQEKLQRRSVLDLLLTSLRQEDLAKVSMPLDLINQLRQKQI